jgi:hypothetical protein
MSSLSEFKGFVLLRCDGRDVLRFIVGDAHERRTMPVSLTASGLHYVNHGADSEYLDIRRAADPFK